MRKVQILEGRVCLLCFILVLPFGLAFGDGMAFMKLGLEKNWELLEQKKQIAFINYAEGKEKLLISVAMAKSKRDIFWLLPLPASPRDVDLELIDVMPSLERRANLADEAREYLEEGRTMIMLSQIYTFFFLIPYKGTRGAGSFGAMAPAGTMEGPFVTVYEHLEKGGMIAEKIAAKDAQALFTYLQGKGINITKGSIPVLDYYIGKDYTFVVSWLSPTYGKEKGPTRGIYLKFPTQKIYYPLLPTSVYGEKEIPIQLYILGYRSPQIYSQIKGYTNVEYEKCGLYWDGGTAPLLREFLGGQQDSVEMTVIDIKAPAKFFASDLWVTLETPLNVRYARFILRHHNFISFLFWLIASILASFLVGWIFFLNLRKDTLTLLALGFFNLFTLFGVILALASLRIEEDKKDVSSLIEELRRKGYLWRRRMSFLLLLLTAALTPIALSRLRDVLYFTEGNFIPAISLFLFPLSFSLMIRFWGAYAQGKEKRGARRNLLGFYLSCLMTVIFFGIISSYFIINPSMRDVISDEMDSFAIIFLTPTIFVLALQLGGVEKNDKPLFSALKEAGYSSWFFTSMERNKLLFIPFFSFTFLFLSWLFVTLAEIPLTSLQ